MPRYREFVMYVDDKTNTITTQHVVVEHAPPKDGKCTACRQPLAKAPQPPVKWHNVNPADPDAPVQHYWYCSECDAKQPEDTIKCFTGWIQARSVLASASSPHAQGD